MILCDLDLTTLLYNGLIDSARIDFTLLNPASIDVRIGPTVILELAHGRFEKRTIPEDGLRVGSGDFLLAETLERFNVPNGYAMELKLKSTSARQGWNQATAVWIDPCFSGRITLEIKNELQYNDLRLFTGQRFAQVIVHKLSGFSEFPYAGRYQGADGVEGPKEVKD